MTISTTEAAPKFLVMASVQSYVFGNTGNGVAALRFSRNGSPLDGSLVIQHTGYTGAHDHANTMTLMWLDYPASSGAMTYRVQAKLTSGGPFRINDIADLPGTSNMIAQEF